MTVEEIVAALVLLVVVVFFFAVVRVFRSALGLGRSRDR